VNNGTGTGIGTGTGAGIDTGTATGIGIGTGTTTHDQGSSMPDRRGGSGRDGPHTGNGWTEDGPDTGDRDTDLTECVVCGARIDPTAWHPVATRFDDDEFQLFAFCDADCRTEWTGDRRTDDD